MKEKRDIVTMYIYDRVEELKGVFSGLKLITGEQF
jgi:hypothetical protein